MALSTSQKPPVPRVRPPNPARDAARARQRARWMEEQRRNADARRAELAGRGKPAAGLGGEDVGGGQVFGGDGNPKVRSNTNPIVADRHAGAGGLDANGNWTAPTNGYLAGLANGTIAPRWAGQPGSPEYQGWLNMRNGGNPIPDGGLPPLPGDDPIPDDEPNTGQQNANRHPNRNRNRQQPAGQVSQAAAQALYNDNTIPHEFKGQLMELARSGNAQSFAETLFGSGIPHETKLRLMQLFGFGGSTGVGNPQPHPQGAPQPAPQNPHPVVPNDPAGSPYYGAY